MSQNTNTEKAHTAAVRIDAYFTFRKGNPISIEEIENIIKEEFPSYERNSKGKGAK